MYHDNYMSLALQLAMRGRFTVSPNPMVGCVIVNEHRIVGQGFHRQAGENHAEIHALKEAGALACGATAYVTLEPCCHQGKTPPCTKALIEAGIKIIYVACLDPNPLMSGKSIDLLRQHDIEVNVGLGEAGAKQLNEIFFHYIIHRRPFVVSKWAMSLDGKTITHPKDTRQISGHASQRHTHDIRRQVDAIVVGHRTAFQDNPRLTARPSVKQPTRIVLSSRGDLPLDLILFDQNLSGKTIIATTVLQKHFPKNVEIMVLPKNHQHQVSLTHLLDELGQREITSVLVEGGMTVHDSFFRENLVNKVCVYIAPVIIGSLEKKQYIPSMSATSLAEDVCLSATLKRNTDV